MVCKVIVVYYKNKTKCRRNFKLFYLTTDNIQNVSQTNTNTVATINISGGQNNVEYTFFCQMTDDTGSTAERSIKLRLKER